MGEDWQSSLLGPDKSEEVEAGWAGSASVAWSALPRSCPVEPFPLLIPKMKMVLLLGEILYVLEEY